MFRFLLISVFLLFPAFVFAADAAPAASLDAANSTYNVLTPVMRNMADKLQMVGIKIFFALTMLQLVITGYGLIASGEIEASLAKYAKAFLWISFCVWLMTNKTASNFVGNTIQYFLNNAIGWASPDLVNTGFNAGSIVQVGMDGLANTMRAVGKAVVPTSTMGWVLTIAAGGAGAAIELMFTGIMVFIIIIIVLGTCGYIALKVFMVKIEAALVLAVLPLSLSFLGLNALREQGFAPFKSMLALIYRIVILGMIVGGLSTQGQVLMDYANSEVIQPNIVQVLVSAVFGFLILAFLAHKSDSIAASLANGSANLGSGDAVGASIAAIATMAAAATGVGAVAGAGAKASKSMSEVMSGLTGGGSVKNASNSGAGKTPEAAPQRTSANPSLASTPKSGEKAPQREGSKALTTPSAANTSPSNVSTAPSASSKAKETSADPAVQPSSNASSSSLDRNSSSETGSSSASNNSEALDTSPPASPGSGLDAGISGVPKGAPKRDIAEDLGKLVDHLSAPKRETHGDKMKRNLGTVGQHVSNEKQATHVSINTNPND